MRSLAENVRALVVEHRKDPRVIITVPLLLLAATSLIYYAVQRAKELSPEALSSQVLLFVLWNINFLLILGILFVLLRGIVKLVLERQRGIIGSRFRTKLVVAWLGTSLVPVVLLFVFATDLLRVSIDRWFNTPVQTILRNGEAIAQMAQDQAANQAVNAARDIAASPGAADESHLETILGRVQQFHGVDMAGVYRDGHLVKEIVNPRAPIQEVSEPPARFFDEASAKGRAIKIDVGASGKWIRVGTRVGETPYFAVTGVFVPAAMSRMIDESIVAHKNFQQLDAQRPTLKASQTSLFLAITLAILFTTLWTSIYASRRITVPIKALAEATSELAKGGYGHRITMTGGDEVGRLIESFNAMSGQIADANERLDSERAYLFTVLDSVSAGIIAFTEEFELLSINRSALAMLDLELPSPRAPLADVLMGDLTPLHDTLRELTQRNTRAREVTLIRGGELRYLELSLARLSGGGDSGWVVAIEDSTQLVQAQKLAAWNEAARRIAHEIKNPLTPIQLSAERIARKFRNGDGDTQQAIEEGTRTIVSEVGELKRMVDEFARFARMPAVHLRHAQLADILQQAASLYRDVKKNVTVAVSVENDDIELLLDPEQIRRAVGNLLKNAVEATDAGEIRVTARRAGQRVVIEIADPGRGVPDADKEKLFLPHFSTKGRGTGLGLAIVHRIVNDHDGRISVHDNYPTGTRFEIELPA